MPKYQHRRASETREWQDRQEPYTGRTKSHQATRLSKNDAVHTTRARYSGTPDVHRDEKENVKGQGSSFKVPDARALPPRHRGPPPSEAVKQPREGFNMEKGTSATVLHPGQPSRPERSLKTQPARSHMARYSTMQKTQDRGDSHKLQLPNNRPRDLQREDIPRGPCGPTTQRVAVEKKQSSSVAQPVVPTSSARGKNAHIDERPVNRARSGTVPTKPQRSDRVLPKNSGEGLSRSKVKEERNAQSSQPRPTVSSGSATHTSKTSDPPKILDHGLQASESSKVPSTSWLLKNALDNPREWEIRVREARIRRSFPCLLRDCCGHQLFQEYDNRLDHMDNKFGGQVQCWRCRLEFNTGDSAEDHRQYDCVLASPLIWSVRGWLRRENLHRVVMPERWDPLYIMVCEAFQHA